MTSKVFTRGGVTATLWRVDCREVLPRLGKVDAVVTDPVWPNCPPGLLHGSDGTQGAILRQTLELCDAARTWVIVMGFDSDPRWLGDSVPSFKPFIRTQQMPYAMPGYRGRLLWGDEIAYIFGEIPRGNGVIPGRTTTEALPKGRRAVDHPCPRSVTHAISLIRWWTLEVDTVLDPFMGSGTTMAAAMRCGRNSVGIEISEKYFAVACERMEREVRQEVLEFKEPAKMVPEAVLL